MKKIPLTQGKFALVDDADYEFLNQWKWCVSKSSCSGKFYAQRRSDKSNGFQVISMHRLLSGAQKKDIVDHINGNPLDNQKSNLRICSIAENSRNAVKPKNNTSGFKGVTWDKDRRRWVAQIKFNRKTINLGRFTCPIEAARTYNSAAIKYFGEFANLNNMSK